MSGFIGKKDRNPEYETVPYIPKNWLDQKGNPIGVSPNNPRYDSIKSRYLSLQLAEIRFIDKAAHIGLFKSTFD